MIYETTIIRRFDVDGTRYVYSAASGSVVALDDPSAAVLDHFGTRGGADLRAWEASPTSGARNEAELESFEELVAMGLLKPSGEVPPPAPDLPPMPYPLATLVLNVTNKCNLSCTYCYEYGEDKIADTKGGAPRMSLEVARKSIDLLFDEAGPRPKVSITFFGGETLLNFDTIREAAEYALVRARECGKSVDFALTTNATLLTDEIIAFLVQHKFGINISIDGAATDHDKHRTFKSGKGSYDLIVPRIKKLLAANKGRGRPIGARVTLTKDASSIVDTYRHLVGEIGFDQVGFAPVTSANDRDYALGGDGMAKILDDFALLADEYVTAATEGRAHGFSNIEDLLRELHQGVNKAHPCGAGLGLLGVSTEGELGLCHRFVESGEHEIGDVESGIDQEKREDFLRSGHVSKKIACHDCFARPHCSGGCYHEAYVRYEDASQPNLHYCDWIRAWTELGLRTYGRIAAANPDFLDRFDGTAAPAPARQADALTQSTPS